MTAIFVYGTLKSNRSARSHLGDSLFLGEYRLDGFQLIEVEGIDFPFMTNLRESSVHGELYLINSETRQILDLIEGHPDLYLRETVGEIKFDGQRLPIEAYVISPEKITEFSGAKPSDFKSVPSGRW